MNAIRPNAEATCEKCGIRFEYVQVKKPRKYCDDCRQSPASAPKLQTWQRDATKLGRLENNKSVRALLCARSAELLAKGENVSEDSDKVSAKDFAAEAGVSDKTVTAYIRTWDAMAEDELVPPRSELSPGVSVDSLPSAEKFTEYYRKANKSAPKTKAEDQDNKDDQGDDDQGAEDINAVAAGLVDTMQATISRFNEGSILLDARTLLRSLMNTLQDLLDDMDQEDRDTASVTSIRKVG